MQLVGDLYRRHIEGAPIDAFAVRLWRVLTRTVLKAPLRNFFDESTEFSKRLCTAQFRPSLRASLRAYYMRAITTLVTRLLSL